MVRIVDLTQPIHNGAVVFPGHLKPVIWRHHTHEETRLRKLDITYATSGLLMSDHGPTHVDSHSHIDPKGESIEKTPLKAFYTDGICLDLSHRRGEAIITKDDLRSACTKHSLKVKRGDTVLIYTGHFERMNGRLEYAYKSPGLGKDAMQWLADQGVGNVGIDTTTIDSTANTAKGTFPAHVICRERKILNTENMANLRAVAGKRFRYAGFPLKIVDGTGSPIRAVAIFD